MARDELFEVGDTFVGEIEELTVIGHTKNGIKVETLAGTTKTVDARSLIEMATEKREPSTL